MKLDSSAFVADPELIHALEARSTRIVCDEERVLFHQGDSATGLFVLRSGTARLTMTSPKGDVLMSMPVSAGSVLGLPALVGNQPYSLTASALKGAELAFVTSQDFSSLMFSTPSLSMSVLRILAAEVRNARSAISGF
ncbi:MAG TPA: cyclic nucleotide-binding domain-containing protein [Terracidiphilus sp.]|nr:cyclic nucleotide-binding domain-containing protein [Terracidiphilus sp.]